MLEAKSYDLDRKERIEILKTLMGGPMGRKWVWWLLSECKIFNSTIGEHHEMCEREGRRTIGLKVYKDIQSDGNLRKQFLVMQEEYVRTQEARKK